ncbi:MAG: acyl-CoA thioesterase [Ignavibacteriales bacterium]|nr:acyl-CoA thioesterase [Ignavibacteriales bacterium]
MKPKLVVSKKANRKVVQDSQVTMVELVLPNDTNQLGALLGGKLMHWIDIAAAISAQRHSGKVCVTASVDEINFHHPIRLGEVVTLRASVNRAFHTSMEVGVQVTSENLLTGEKKTSNTAYLTFVALDSNGRPSEVFPIFPETNDEKRRFKEALLRRERRLQNRKPLSPKKGVR